MIRQNENGRKTALDGDKTTIVRDRGIASEKEPEDELVAENVLMWMCGRRRLDRINNNWN